MKICQIVEGLEITNELTPNYPEYIKQKSPQLYSILQKKGPTAAAKVARAIQKSMIKVKQTTDKELTEHGDNKVDCDGSYRKFTGGISVSGNEAKCPECKQWIKIDTNSRDYITLVNHGRLEEAAPKGTVKPLKPMNPNMKDPVVVDGIGTMERKQAEQHYKGFPLKK